MMISRFVRSLGLVQIKLLMVLAILLFVASWAVPIWYDEYQKTFPVGRRVMITVIGREGVVVQNQSMHSAIVVYKGRDGELRDVRTPKSWLRPLD